MVQTGVSLTCRACPQAYGFGQRVTNTGLIPADLREKHIEPPGSQRQ